MDDGSVSNEDLIKLMWELYPNGPSLGLKIVLQSLAGRVTTVPLQHQVITVPVTVGADTEVVSEWQNSPTATEQESVSENHKDDTSASAENTAGDNPVKDMPQSARERADIRMGKSRPGKI